MDELCEHLMPLQRPDRPPVKPSGHGCQECLEAGGEWVHLRLCMSCGHVGCCDSSPHTHATKHAHKTEHPTIRSYEPGEKWEFCYPDELTVDDALTLPGEEPPRHYSPARH
jgi:uncharacterized UBP type Zn finger protein